ncbi:MULTISPECIES: hypothetical protein [unclassified Iodidimonas]|jgi:hypothetical protein|uniref:hypothetical protein n=1 Tax=unclassified Iodidimonas TaxID=2626145 RepID=UPI002482A8FC|nr:MULTISPECIES: hypothetical protein [unclassified Iodidimonas]
MDVNSFIIYLHELRNQCLYTHSALNIFNQCLEQKNQTGVLFAGQSALSAAAQVGAILWPSRARARRRGEVLREKLQLPESHALGDRRFVELWEHADEKLDDWVKTTKGERVLFDFVGDPKTINLPGLKESSVYRLYDTTSQILVFRGVGYNLGNLAKAIEEIGRRAEVLMKQIMEQSQAAQNAQNPNGQDSANGPATSPAPSASGPQMGLGGASEGRAEEPANDSADDTDSISPLKTDAPLADEPASSGPAAEAKKAETPVDAKPETKAPAKAETKAPAKSEAKAPAKAAAKTSEAKKPTKSAASKKPAAKSGKDA